LKLWFQVWYRKVKMSSRLLRHRKRLKNQVSLTSWTFRSSWSKIKETLSWSMAEAQKLNRTLKCYWVSF
jgi:hypothetical protein